MKRYLPGLEYNNNAYKEYRYSEKMSMDKESFEVKISSNKKVL